MVGQKSNTQGQFKLKSPKPRYINIYEDIFLVLSIEALKIYMTLRYESDYARDCSSVARNIQFIINKTGISRRKIIYCFKELEQYGLLFIERKKGFQSVYWVTSDLNHFNKTHPEEPVHEVHDPVHEVHDPVHEVHDINNNLCINNTNNIEPEGSPSVTHEELINVYIEEFPNLSHPRNPKKPNKQLSKVLNTMIRAWHRDISENGNKLTEEIFRLFLRKLKEINYWAIRQDKDAGMVVLCRIDRIQDAIEKIIAHEKQVKR